MRADLAGLDDDPYEKPVNFWPGYLRSGIGPVYGHEGAAARVGYAVGWDWLAVLR